MGWDRPFGGEVAPARKAARRLEPFPPTGESFDVGAAASWAERYRRAVAVPPPLAAKRSGSRGG